MKNDQVNRFDRLLQVKAPASLSKALDAAASAKLTTRSSYIRSALLDRLREDGITVSLHAAA